MNNVRMVIFQRYNADLFFVTLINKDATESIVYTLDNDSAMDIIDLLDSGTPFEYTLSNGVNVSSIEASQANTLDYVVNEDTFTRWRRKLAKPKATHS